MNIEVFAMNRCNKHQSNGVLSIDALSIKILRLCLLIL